MNKGIRIGANGIRNEIETHEKWNGPLFEMHVHNRYDDNIYDIHTNILKENQKCTVKPSNYNPDIHYPLLLSLTKLREYDEDVDTKIAINAQQQN